MSETQIPRAMTFKNIMTKRRDLIHFVGKFFDAIGHPELAGSWIIWAGSGHGKTATALAIAKEMTKFTSVLYNTIEEGDSESFRLALIDAEMEEVQDRILFLDKEPIEVLRMRLKRHKHPRCIFIDSWQYADLTVKAYKALIKEFPKVLFIFVSHAEGKEPEGKSAKKVRYDAMVKIRVEGFVAFCSSRYKRGVSKPMVIVEKKALEYWGDIPTESNLK